MNDRPALLRPLALLVTSAAPHIFPALACAQPTYTEQLTADATYWREECLGPCACHIVTNPYPMTGTFVLVFDHADQWTSFYTVTNVDFTSRSLSEPTVHFTGSGTYHIGGDFALTQHLVLDLVQDGQTTVAHFDSGEVVGSGGVSFPSISISATTGVVGCTRKTLAVRAAPGEAPPCPADLGSSGGAAGADGHLDNNDFIVFINFFFDSNPAADRGQAGGLAGSDGQFDNNDFIVFINQFFAGC
jgi:hypothetical protein